VLAGDRRALERAGWTEKLAPVIDTGGGPPPAYGKPCAAGGTSSFKAVRLAARLALSGRARAIVTAPVCKQSWSLAKTGYKDHTSFFREICPDALMLFTAGNIRCALVSEHCAVAALPGEITRAKILSRAKKFCAALKYLGIKKPRVALCALNPHAGDGGVLGTEEKTVISPAAAALRRAGIDISGPLPSDAAWARHIDGEFDGILCMYHDQALVPLKLAAKCPPVHRTFGLPFARTSPAHGAAFDIAGKNRAAPSGMIEAILAAAEA